MLLSYNWRDLHKRLNTTIQKSVNANDMRYTAPDDRCDVLEIVKVPWMSWSKRKFHENTSLVSEGSGDGNWQMCVSDMPNIIILTCYKWKVRITKLIYIHDDFHSCTLHFGVIKFFICLTNAQLNCFKMLKFTLWFTINTPTYLDLTKPSSGVWLNRNL